MRPVDPWAARWPDVPLPQIDYNYDRVTDQDKSKIVSLHHWGLCTEYLAERFGLRQETISKYLREGGVKSRRAA